MQQALGVPFGIQQKIFAGRALANGQHSMNVRLSSNVCICINTNWKELD